MYHRILVPTDGSDITAKTVQSAVALAQALGAEIFTIGVKEQFPFGAASDIQPVPPRSFFDDQERVAVSHVQAVVAACAAAGVVCHAATVDAMTPWEAIIDHATANACDLLVMGSHGRSGFAAFLLGSETRDVLSHTTLPVLIVR